MFRCGRFVASRRLCGVSPGSKRAIWSMNGGSSARSSRQAAAAAAASGRNVGGGIWRAGFGTVVLGGALGGTAYAYRQHSLHADHDEDAYQPAQRGQAPLTTLLRSYVVYSLCAVPALVDWSPTILATMFAIPGVKQVTEAIVRVTFFSQVRSLS